MKGTFYHGTTTADLPAIKRNGLRKGTWVSPERSVAFHFAEARAAWNGSMAIVLEVEVRVGPIRNDRSGRPECQTKEVTKPK